LSTKSVESVGRSGGEARRERGEARRQHGARGALVGLGGEARERVDGGVAARHERALRGGAAADARGRGQRGGRGPRRCDRHCTRRQ
jgi:hypothetical protein